MIAWYFSDCIDPEHLTHAVLVTGYGVTSNGDEYYMVKNSWGDDWGEDGYVRMARNRHNICGIADNVYYPEL